MNSVGLLASRRRMRLAAACALAAILAGCSSVPGGESVSDKLANALAFNGTKPPPVSSATVDPDVNCPIVDITEGGASARVYAGGQSNSNVRYQYSMGDLARDCSVQNNQIVMKVGIEGKVLLGPAGSPSSFTVPVKVSVRRETDEKILESKVYRAAATIPAGSALTTFTIVTDPIVLPFLGENAFDDYQVFVGFDGTGGSLPPSKRRRR